MVEYRYQGEEVVDGLIITVVLIFILLANSISTGGQGDTYPSQLLTIPGMFGRAMPSTLVGDLGISR